MAIHVYPVQKTDIVCENYEVKVNGQKAELNTARVSAVPFNRRWPGHQRTKDQTELVNFLSMSFDEPVTFEITPKEPFENVIIRPLSLGVQPEIADGVIRFTMDKPAYFTVEPYGRRNALHIFADPVKDYGVDKNSENVLYYGAGVHDVGTIELKSNQTLFLDEGAVVYAIVRAYDAENIKILGRGILDNSRNVETIHFEVSAEDNEMMMNNATRLHTVQIEYCTNVEIDGITIRDSLVYNVRPVGCHNLFIKNIKLIGNWRYNSDGIDMHNCVDVRIMDCFLRTFDDAICVKGFDFYNNENAAQLIHDATYHNGKVYDVFQNVHVSGCVVWNDWAKSLEIGAETKAEDISNVLFENCNVIHVTGPALDCYNVDYAHVHDITYRDINVEFDDIIPQPVLQAKDSDVYADMPKSDDYAPSLIHISCVPHAEYSGGSTRVGKNTNIRFENIHLTGRQKIRILASGYDEEHKVSGVIVKDLYQNGKKITDTDEINLQCNAFVEDFQLL